MSTNPNIPAQQQPEELIDQNSHDEIEVDDAENVAGGGSNDGDHGRLID